MAKREVAITTLRRNIERDQRKYYIKHRTHLLLMKMAEAENRTTGAELDELIAQSARNLLDPATIAEVEAEARTITDHRRAEAEERRPELEQKRASKRASKEA